MREKHDVLDGFDTSRAIDIFYMNQEGVNDT